MSAAPPVTNRPAGAVFGGMQLDTAPPPAAPAPPAEVLPEWRPAQRLVARLATGPIPSVATLRTTGLLPHDRAVRIAEWYTGPPVADARAVVDAYAALRAEVAVLAGAIAAPYARGGLGVQVALMDTVEEPYADAADLCRELRVHETMSLRAASADAPHPLLPDASVDHLRTVHDVLGHAALGLGFDLQSEYAAWLYCAPLFSPLARPAAFCELVGAVTVHVLTGAKPAFHADLPPAGLCPPLTPQNDRSPAVRGFR